MVKLFDLLLEWPDHVFKLSQQASALTRFELTGHINICTTWSACYQTLQDCCILSYSWRAKYALVIQAGEAAMWKTYVLVTKF